MKTLTSHRITRGLGRLAFAAAASTVLLTGLLATPAGAVSPPYVTSTAIAASPTAPVNGQAVTFTATVTSSTAPTLARKPWGTVVFTIKGADATAFTCDAGNTVTFTTSPATCTFAAGLAASDSPYSVHALYTDTADTRYLNSSRTVSVPVALGPTTTTVASTPNPSVSSEPITVTATVAASGGSVGTPTGTVTFTGLGIGACVAGEPVVSGVATCIVPNGLLRASQPYNVKATYLGDTEFAGSVGTLVQNVRQAPATLALTISPDTCVSGACPETPGVPLTLTATATSVLPATGVPTGPVVFSIIPAGQTTSLTCQSGNTVTLVAGVGTCDLPTGIPASVFYVATATLTDKNYKAPPATLDLNVDLVSTTTSVVAPAGVTAGVSFPVVATVTGAGVGSPYLPTGFVAMTVCTTASPQVCQGSPVFLQSDGTATLFVRGGEFTGSYTVHARYLGDQNYWGSTAPSGPTTQFAVTPTPTHIIVKADNNPSDSGAAVNITVVLIADNGAATSSLVGPPTGTLAYGITDTNGVHYRCAGGNRFTLRAGHIQGAFTCYVPPGTLTAANGPYTVRVNYSGDANYLAHSTTFTQVVVVP